MERKYLELFKEGFPSDIAERTAIENRPYVGYSIKEKRMVYTDIEIPFMEIGNYNNKEEIIKYAGKTVNVQVNRTFKANDGYYTLCLPFDLDASEIGKAYQVTSITEYAAGEGLNVIFNEVTTIEAGQPYLILPKDLTNPIFENVTITYTGEGEKVHAEGAGINFDMIGVINGGGKTGQGQYWVGANGRFFGGDGAPTDKLGLRVLFDIKGMPTGSNANVVIP